MPFRLVLGLYRLLLPLFLLSALPGWLVRMGRRGGFGSGLRERFSIYTRPEEEEPCGAVHLHSISVGETMLALKLIRAWRERDPGQRFVLATGTATGHAVAKEAALADVRVTYSPVDLRFCVARYLNRFEPAQLVLVEGEAWPHLLLGCRKRGIPVSLVNARLSPRSEKRYRKLASIVRPVFGMLDKVAAQEPADVERWEALGVERGKIRVTGSSKFDPGAAVLPSKREDFAQMLDTFGKDRAVVLSSSTHGDEEAWIAKALREIPALCALVPRHAERRAEVKAALEKEGFEVVLRSSFHPPRDPARACFVIDSTGELRDWTAHATLVVIGKSILGKGGQSPVEAILGRKPLLFGPHMQNFEPLCSSLVAAGGAIRFHDDAELAASVLALLEDPARAARMCDEAARVLATHSGATGRMVDMLRD